MSVILGIGIGAVSLISIGGFVKITWVGITLTLLRLKRKKSKKNLKQRLNFSMINLNYTEFIDIIYEIKNYDDKYHKKLYVKVKTQFFFNEKHFDCLKSFQRRFDSSFDIKQENLKKMIHYEVELSISQIKDRLDL